MITLGLLLCGGLFIVACNTSDTEDSSPTLPGSASAAANFYTSGGVGTGQIGAYVQTDEFVLNLPAGQWRVTYTLRDGGTHTRYVSLDAESLCYFGFAGTVDHVEVEPGSFTGGEAAILMQLKFHSGLRILLKKSLHVTKSTITRILEKIVYKIPAKTFSKHSGVCAEILVALV